MSSRRTTPFILVAEDDSDDRLMIQEAFEESFADCRVSFVHDGVELMKLLRDNGVEPHQALESSPDMVLLDLNMPLKDGRQSLLEIESDPTLRHLCIVVMTTSSNPEDAAFCREHGASAYVVKPTTFSELSRIVGSLKERWPGSGDQDNKEFP